MLWIWAIVTVIGVIIAALLGSLAKPLSTRSVVILVALVAASFGVAAGSYPIAHHVAQRGAIGGYHQFINANVTAAHVEVINCTEDGSCEHHYDCDSYQVYDGTDKNGNAEYHTEWRKCPYATQEFTYTIHDTYDKDERIVADHIFSAHPQKWRSWGFHSLPSNVQRGEPAGWTQIVNDLQAGLADPITLPDVYDNYILASEDAILKASSDNIARLTRAHLLPDHTANLQDPIYGVFQADKMSFIGFRPSDTKAWQQSLMQFNAALGMQRQGDMHVVAIKASALPHGVSSEDYLNALKAYWLNDLGKNAIAKNGIILVLGVDNSGSKVVWSKAATGMPVGNGAMLASLSSDLEGTAFSPSAVFGTTEALATGSKVTYAIGHGAVSQIVMVDFPFVRSCMACQSKNDAAHKGQGFIYLSTDIPLGGWGIVLTILVDFVILLLLAFGALLLLGVDPTDLSGPSGPSSRFNPSNRFDRIMSGMDLPRPRVSTYSRTRSWH